MTDVEIVDQVVTQFGLESGVSITPISPMPELLDDTEPYLDQQFVHLYSCGPRLFYTPIILCYGLSRKAFKIVPAMQKEGHQGPKTLSTGRLL